ncbi:MAG: protein kinase [Prevotella sp.]|nr:protein kinase [Prevotella sp.]
MSENINSQSMLPVGTLLQGGKYRVDRYLSSGGFGNTYVATNTEFEEEVALKEFFMRGISERDGDSVTVSVSNKTNVDQFTQQKDKFRKEARRLRKLRNDHIVSVHDLFEENGTTYYVMDFIDGESMSARLKRTGQPLTEGEALDILGQVLDALEVVHAQGLYHLDIKPANIMVDGTGRAVLIDFGASKQTKQEGGATTSTGLCYTPGYAPIEQMEQNLEKFGPWTDIYALGASLYYMLTLNVLPPPTDIQEDGAAALPMPGVSEGTQNLIRRMMTPLRTQRPQSVAAVRQLLSAKPKAVVEDEGTVVITGKKATGDEETEVLTPKPKAKAEPVKVREEPVVVDVEDEGKKKSPLLLWGGIGVGVVVVVIAVVLFVLPSKKPEATFAEQVPEAVEKPETVKDMTYTSAVKDGVGTYTYNGPVDSDKKPHGRGTATFPNGDRYEGPFVHGVLEGKDGKYILKEGGGFEGELRADHFYSGKYTFADGSYLIGTWINGEGHGKMYDKNGKQYDEI